MWVMWLLWPRRIHTVIVQANIEPYALVLVWRAYCKMYEDPQERGTWGTQATLQFMGKHVPLQTGYSLFRSGLWGGKQQRSLLRLKQWLCTTRTPWSGAENNEKYKRNTTPRSNTTTISLTKRKYNQEVNLWKLQIAMPVLHKNEYIGNWRIGRWLCYYVFQETPLQCWLSVSCHSSSSLFLPPHLG